MRFLSLLWCLLILPAVAVAEFNSSVDGIAVEATGTNASEAKEIAVAEGEQAAFRKLIEQMEPERAAAIIAGTPRERISAMVRGYEVVEEKMSPKSYRATLRYNFDPRQLSRVVQMESTAVSTTAGVSGKKELFSKPLNPQAILLLPVWKDRNVYRFWEAENIWRLIWGSLTLQYGNGLIVVPFGDQRDQRDMEGGRVLESDFVLLAPVAERYGTGQIWTMYAEVDEDDPAQTLIVTLRKISPNTNIVKEEYRYPLKARETLNAQMQRAAIDILKRIQNTQPATAASEEQVNTLTVHMMQVDLKDWEEIRRKLLKVPAMQKVDVISMSYYQTSVLLTYRGNPELLGKMLAAAGFRLFRDKETLVLGLPS
jgi:hypothetical protein